MKKRIEWVDVAKAIAIIAMIVGHEVPHDYIYFFIFSFHMPLFFILSGYTSGSVTTWTKFKLKLKKSFINVWLLAAIMVILLGLENFLFSNSKLSISQMINNDVMGIYHSVNTVPNVSVMWFLFCFFWAKVLFDAVQVIFPNCYNGVILGIFAFFGYVTSQHIWLPQNFDIVPIAAWLMWIGSFWRKLEERRKKFSLNYSLLYSGLFIFWIFCIQNRMSVEMALRHFPMFIFSILEAVAGTISISFVAKAFATTKCLLPLNRIGKHTLAALCIHHLDLYWVIWDKYITSWWLACLLRLLVDIILLVVFVLIENHFSRKANAN